MDLTKWLKLQWDRLAAWACVLAGALALLLGWIGVSGEAYLANQLPYLISGGIGGIFFLGLGAMLWLSADLRDEWQKLDRIERRLAEDELAAISDHSSRSGAVAARLHDDATSVIPAISSSRGLAAHAEEL